MSMTPYGPGCQFNASNDGKGKFRACLARIYNQGMSEYFNRKNMPVMGNPFKEGTQKHSAWRDGWYAGEELQKNLDAQVKQSL